MFKITDIKDFDKTNKKEVSELIVQLQLEGLGWSTYTPWNDTGIDIVATKNVGGKELKRFIQVKTRRTDHKGTIGVTFKPKDFIRDPRKIFILFEDEKNVMAILSSLELVQLYTDAGYSYTSFGTDAFRVGNNKINGFYIEDNNMFFKTKTNNTDLSSKSSLHRLESMELDNSTERNELNRMLDEYIFGIPEKITHSLKKSGYDETNYTEAFIKENNDNSKIDIYAKIPSKLADTEKSYYRKAKEWK